MTRRQLFGALFATAATPVKREDAKPIDDFPRRLCEHFATFTEDPRVLYSLQDTKDRVWDLKLKGKCVQVGPKDYRLVPFRNGQYEDA